MSEWVKNTGERPELAEGAIIDVWLVGCNKPSEGHTADQFAWSCVDTVGCIDTWRLHTEGDITTKSTNPKDAIGSSKLPLHLWPASATMTGTLGLLDGTLKYGRANWRVSGVRASIYIDAVLRHVNAYREGETNDPDSGVPHLGHALACLAILVDSEAAGKLNDDRNIEGGYRALVEKLTPHVERLKVLHEDKSPKHFTIADNA